MSVLILGATSEIGGEIARRMAPGQTVILASRRPLDLKELEKELQSLGATNTKSLFFDAEDLGSHEALFSDVLRRHRKVEHVVVCFGILGEQARAETDWQHAAQIATVDYTAQVVALTVAAQSLKEQNIPATITSFSSIAGWRARRANYVYGSTKAGLDAFCQGLADALHGTPVRLIIARPGFVIGRMTADMKPAPMSVRVADVAEVVVKQIRSGRRSVTVWIPQQLRLLAWIMKLVPRPVWRTMPR